jgi:hypothetical protein
METGSLNDRIIIQKIAYLLSRKGIDTGYSDFSWYLHGVFSWDLWHDIIRSWNVNPAAIPSQRMLALSQTRVEFEQAGLASYFHDANGLEMITTILRCAERQEALREDNSELTARVMALKSKFGEAQVRTAIGRVRKVNWNFR